MSPGLTASYAPLRNIGAARDLLLLSGYEGECHETHHDHLGIGAGPIVDRRFCARSRRGWRRFCFGWRIGGNGQRLVRNLRSHDGNRDGWGDRRHRRNEHNRQPVRQHAPAQWAKPVATGLAAEFAQPVSFDQSRSGRKPVQGSLRRLSAPKPADGGPGPRHDLDNTAILRPAFAMCASFSAG